MSDRSDHTPGVVTAVTDGIEVWIHVRPGGRRNAVEGGFDGALAVRVSAAPTKGQANQAVERTLAEAFGVRPPAVSVVVGPASRRKKSWSEGRLTD
ncbi:MAG: DUF167 domain-containing protein [Acidimicrobiales bacterium]